MTAIFSLNTLVIAAILISAAVAVTSEKILSSVIALGVTGAFVALEFIILHAPDVAISEAAVGAVLSTALFIVAIRKTTKRGEEEE
ncbi:MAG: DUF4040 domain-containing protein [Firmicutes bacterium]|jgi:uncharacterized MnhB-related membrane protein|nr:DUF4040 domain-containing protein [Bacillota bacterium]MBQ2058932.1 DUF4040 domain-containing protein [Bacillota bacterium]